MGDTRENASPLPLELFDYELPQELIAQTPLAGRADSRLMVVQRDTGDTCHTTFREIGRWLSAGDLLVLNDTRVMRSRFMAKRSTGGRVELLVLEENPAGGLRSMTRPARRLKPGEVLTLLDADDRPSEFSAQVARKGDDGVVDLYFPAFDEAQQRVGRVPLPHYITKHLDDPERYQTIYAEEPGSVAAPTAGLHFTDELLDELTQGGIEIATVTLHVGLGTFQPVRVSDAREHQMHAERFRVDPAALEQIRSARREGRRVVAVGTTSCRTLESIAGDLTAEAPLEGSTSLFITPGYEFKLVDALVTNFHLPRSTLLMLVSAFAGRELVLRVYQEAIRESYRFYSFGDAMLIL